MFFFKSDSILEGLIISRNYNSRLSDTFGNHSLCKTILVFFGRSILFSFLRRCAALVVAVFVNGIFVVQDRRFLPENFMHQQILWFYSFIQVETEGTTTVVGLVGSEKPYCRCLLF